MARGLFILLLTLVAGCSLGSDLSVPTSRDTGLDLGDDSDAELDASRGEDASQEVAPDVDVDLAADSADADLPDAGTCDELSITVTAPAEGVGVSDLDLERTRDSLWLAYASTEADRPSVVLARIFDGEVEKLHSETEGQVFGPVLSSEGETLAFSWISDDPDGGNIHSRAYIDTELLAAASLFEQAGPHVAAADVLGAGFQRGIVAWSQLPRGTPDDGFACPDDQSCVLVGNRNKATVVTQSKVRTPTDVRITANGTRALVTWVEPDSNLLAMQQLEIASVELVGEPQHLEVHMRTPRPHVIAVEGGWWVASVTRAERVQTIFVPLDGAPSLPGESIIPDLQPMFPTFVRGRSGALLMAVAVRSGVALLPVGDQGEVPDEPDSWLPVENGVSADGLAAISAESHGEVIVAFASSSGVFLGWFDENLEPLCPPWTR